MGSHTISTSRPRSLALLRSVVVTVAMSFLRSPQVRHRLRQNRILALRTDAGHVARRRAARVLLRMRVRTNVVPARLRPLLDAHPLAAHRDALARIFGMSLAANSHAVVLHAVRHYCLQGGS